MANNNIEISITLGGGAELAMTRDKQLILRQEYAPGLHCTVQLGRCTLKRINELQELFARLKVHCIIED